MIKAFDIRKRFGELEVLKGINLEIKKKEVVCILGASGAGKSTLLQILGTLDNDYSGRVEIAGKNVSQLKEKELAAFRNKNVGFVFQFHHLLPEFTALENVCIPALIGGVDQASAQKKALELLKKLGLSDRCNHKPSELSGGEQQRVAVARALINDPAIVFADEPSGNLDSQSARDLHKLFFQLRDDLGQTFLIVTHNPDLAKMADRCITIKDGKNE